MPTQLDLTDDSHTTSVQARPSPGSPRLVLPTNKSQKEKSTAPGAMSSSRFNCSFLSSFRFLVPLLFHCSADKGRPGMSCSIYNVWDVLLNLQRLLPPKAFGAAAFSFFGFDSKIFLSLLPQFFPNSFSFSFTDEQARSHPPLIYSSAATIPHPHHFALGETTGHFIPPLAGAASAGGGEVLPPAAVGLRCPWPVKRRFIPPASDSPLLLPPLPGGGDGAPPEPLTKPERPVMLMI
jgi:hypothetical protein